MRGAAEASAWPAFPPRAVLCGLFGSFIAQSRSPLMHEREAAALGRRLIYRLVDFQALGKQASDLPMMLDAAGALGFDGLNITHPFKQAVLPLLDGLSETARAIGAVNTVCFTSAGRIGHNTDATGFSASFRAGLPGAALGQVVQLGAGGAGAAVAHAVLELGAGCIALHDPAPDRAQSLAASLCARFGAGRARLAGPLAPELAAADGLLQTSPIGMTGHPGLPLDPALLRPALWVADIVYFPRETALLRAARAIGCPVLGGAGMAVSQAAEALELFIGQKPDVVRMLRDFDSDPA